MVGKSRNSKLHENGVDNNRSSEIQMAGLEWKLRFHYLYCETYSSKKRQQTMPCHATTIPKTILQTQTPLPEITNRDTKTSAIKQTTQLLLLDHVNSPDTSL